ncbi:DMT family transporter [Saccharomonospora saliphila]|uniref:DMT family transporter n=1 Tax=Saccharomonospora saliphila TaxID=369829 RepID=UPI0003631B9C|nr:SMR family transporter [Saccharomonospora saliphila]
MWALALHQAEGFTRLWPSVFGVTVAATSFALLTLALRDLPVGTAYAVWVGVGAVGVAVAGRAVAHEPVTPARVLFLALIIAGVIGLRLTDTA